MMIVGRLSNDSPKVTDRRKLSDDHDYQICYEEDTKNLRELEHN